MTASYRLPREYLDRYGRSWLWHFDSEHFTSSTMEGHALSHAWVERHFGPLTPANAQPPLPGAIVKVVEHWRAARPLTEGERDVSPVYTSEQLARAHAEVLRGTVQRRLLYLTGWEDVNDE